MWISGDKKRRDVVQCIEHVPKYNFFVTASQKGIICQWSNKVIPYEPINLNNIICLLYILPFWVPFCSVLALIVHNIFFIISDSRGKVRDVPLKKNTNTFKFHRFHPLISEYFTCYQG
jgi:hypothetical protein